MSDGLGREWSATNNNVTDKRLASMSTRSDEKVQPHETARNGRGHDQYSCEECSPGGPQRKTANNYDTGNTEDKDPQSDIEGRHRTVSESDKKEINEYERSDKIDNPGNPENHAPTPIALIVRGAHSLS